MARLESLPCCGCQPAPALEAEDCQAEDFGILADISPRVWMLELCTWV